MRGVRPVTNFAYVVGRKQRVSNDDYVRVALKFLSKNSIDQLTTRALGQALGVDPTAIYRHFPSLDDLMTAVRDHIHLLIIERADGHQLDGKPPRERVRAILMATRHVYAEHPQLSMINISGHGRLPNGVELSRRVLAGLEEMGLSGEDLAVGYQMLEGATVGMSIFDNSKSPQHLSIRQEQYGMIGGALASVATSTASVALVNDKAFEGVIDAVLDACEALAAR